MRVNVIGEKVPKEIARMYVDELLKTQPKGKISSVDIIVEDGFLKVKCKFRELKKSA